MKRIARSELFHQLPAHLVGKRLSIIVVGAGGNGAQVLGGLARMHLAMMALGHPSGLHVTAFDDDLVSDSNIGRQCFFPSDVGSLKAVCAVNRINCAYGFDWSAIPARFPTTTPQPFDLLISCIDTRAGRRELHSYLQSSAVRGEYWLDLGNFESAGQVVLGEIASARRRASLRLPCVTELFPQLLDESQPEANQHSCSQRISLQSQGLFINDFVARIALQLLYTLLTKGRITSHGALVNIDSMRMNSIPVDPAVWARYGYSPSPSARGLRRTS